MKILMIENFVDLLDIEERLLLDDVLVIDGVGTYQIDYLNFK